MRRSSSIRCLSEVIGETSVTDESTRSYEVRAALSQLNADTSRKQVRRRRPHNCRLRLSSITDIVPGAARYAEFSLCVVQCGCPRCRLRIFATIVNTYSGGFEQYGAPAVHSEE